MGSLHPTHLFPLGLGSELGMGVDFVRIRTTLSLFLSLSLSLSFFYNSLQENPFPLSPPTLSENKNHFLSPKKHNTHTLSLCFPDFALFLSVFKHILEQNFQDSKQSTLYFQAGDRKPRNHCSGNQAQE